MPYVSIFTATCLGLALPPTKVTPEGVPSPTSSTAKGAEHVPEVALSTKLLGHVQLTTIAGLMVELAKKLGRHVHVLAPAVEVE
jgi:hypothetical protein